MNLIKTLKKLKDNKIPSILFNHKEVRYLLYPDEEQLMIESDVMVVKVDYDYHSLLNKKPPEILQIINELLTTK